MKHLERFDGLSGMNQSAQEWVQQAQHHFDNYREHPSTTTSKHQHQATVLADVLDWGDITSPIMTRDYSNPPNREIRSEGTNLGTDCRRVLTTLQADRLVIGHTVQDQINSAMDGRVWRIDVGASAAYGGPTEVLEIRKQQQHNARDEIVSILTADSGDWSAKERQAIQL
eukprot:CAMPEP_0116577876 /NCGR_PEP_ID=MMETSP0397-20121206/21386_1 /TAXON_ID=216820 /ORGANISM="Cyclophora tenuis, Strain ECT3854" /LENGTH=169 /DNA_ID=CAMNT_0004107187 /DNA_START=58 /DNA_END=567 /DNA_ORIENTATION=+